MTGPGHGAAALLTGDGTEKTYNLTLRNVSGAPITKMSLVTIGWQVKADAGIAQKQLVGNSVTITSATVDYPVGGTLANMDVGATADGALRQGVGVDVTTPIPDGADFNLQLKSTPPNGAKYSANFGLIGVRTHAYDNTLREAIYVTGDSIITNDGGYAINAATDAFPLVQQSVIGNKLQYAAAMAADYAAVAAALGVKAFLPAFGANDLGSRTAAQALTDWQTLRDAMLVYSVPTYAVPVSPRVTSDDGSYSPGHQTVAASESVRLTYNVSMRAQPLVFDMAAACESPTTVGNWRWGSSESGHLVDDQNITCSAVSSQTAITCSDMTLNFGATPGASLLATSGANAGTSRTVGSTSGTIVLLNSAFPNNVAIGDTFTIQPGCKKSTTDGLHLGAPYTSGTTFGGFYLARDAFRTLWNAILKASGKSPYVAWGTINTGSIFGTASSAVVALPFNAQVGDRLYIAVATANQPVVVPAGWTQRASVGTGAAGGVSSTCIQLLEKDTAFAIGDAAPTISATADHCVYHMFAVRRAKPSGSAVTVVGSATDTSGGTAISFPDITTTDQGSLILNIGADDFDSSAARVSAGANANLLFFTERLDAGNVTGNGSGLFIFSGMQSAAGATGQTTCTHTQTGNKALLTVAIGRDT